MTKGVSPGDQTTSFGVHGGRCGSACAACSGLRQQWWQFDIIFIGICICISIIIDGRSGRPSAALGAVKDA
jgi:hypothetical protein